MFDILKRGKSYYCLRCLREGRLQRISKYVAGISGGAFFCRYHKELGSADVAVGEYTNLYCPQCAVEGKLQKVLIIYTSQGKYYFCKKHRFILNPISKQAAKRYIDEAKKYASRGWISTPSQTTSIKDSITRSIQSIKSVTASVNVQKIPFAFLWGILYCGVGKVLERFSPSGATMLPILAIAGIIAAFIYLFRPEV